jgi:hypothetical protein
MDHQELLYESRIESAKESITRSRVAFLINVLAAFTLMLGDWNAYFSWYTEFLDEKCTAPNCANLAVAQEQIVKAWVDSLIVSISPLGIKFGISDVSIVGTLALLILSIVFVYCTRRENHAIGYLLVDTREKPRDLREAIYYAVSSHLVFLPVGDSDRPIDRLQYNLGEQKKSVFRYAFDVLIFFPAIACLVIFTVEILSVFVVPAPLRLGHPILWEIVKTKPTMKIQFFEMEAVCLFISVMTLWACNRARRYSNATASVVRAYRDELVGDSQDSLKAGTRTETI